MTKKKTIIIALTTFIVLAVLLFFTNFGFYKANVYPDGVRKFLIRKIDNPNMLMNFFKPTAESILDYGDLVIHKSPELMDPPFAKKANVCSRIIAKPGDIVSIIGAKVYVNNELVEEEYDRYFRYRVNAEENTNFYKLLKEFKVHIIDSMNNNKACDIVATKYKADKIEECIGVINVRQIIDPKEVLTVNTFPYQTYPWNHDNFGPLIIPGKGVTVSLTRKSINLYKKIIDFYEEHDLSVFGEIIEIDGKVVNEYVIQDNYYFVLNDNRYDGDDSRKWGFVPESFIVGKVIN